MPVLEAACAATGTCLAAREAVAATECAAQKLRSAGAAHCRTYHYIDGAVVRAGEAAKNWAFGLAALALSVAAAGVAARKK